MLLYRKEYILSNILEAKYAGKAKNNYDYSRTDVTRQQVGHYGMPYECLTCDALPTHAVSVSQSARALGGSIHPLWQQHLIGDLLQLLVKCFGPEQEWSVEVVVRVAGCQNYQSRPPCHKYTFGIYCDDHPPKECSFIYKWSERTILSDFEFSNYFHVILTLI